MENLFKSRLFARIFFTTTAAVILLFVVMYLLSVPFIQSTVEGIEARNAQTVLDNVYGTVEEIHRNLENIRQSQLLARKQELRNIIAVVESRADWLERQVLAGKLAREQAKRILLEELRHIQYGHGDYVWASDYRSVLVSHPDPKLNGADFSSQRDVRGNLIVPPMVAGARAAGEGFHSYWWRRLGEAKPIEKLTFYKHLPAFGLVIGTGVYIDDIDAVLSARRASAIDELRRQLRTVRLAQTGYVYIFDGKNQMIIHPNANIEGKNITGMLDPVTKKPIFPMLKAVADKAEGFRYKWDSPADPGNYVHDKISWARHFRGDDWYICSSVYVDELDESARILRNRMLAVFAATLLLSITLVYLLVKRLVDPLKHLSDTALRVENGDFDARCALRRDDEIGVVATAFNGMLDQLQDNIRHLDTKVSERTAELEKANEELKELDQIKSDFLSSVSHELRTPTTAIIGFSKRVKKKLDDTVFPQVAADGKTARIVSQVRENLDIIVHESERLALLIDGVLDSAKLDAGKVEWNFAPLAPARLIEGAAAIAAVLTEQKGLTLSWQVEPGLPEVTGDEERLLQVLTNLISNAVKFTDHGFIVLSAARQDQFVIFGVRDSGIGIAREDQSKVFDKFRQIGDPLIDKPQGTGLGLSICRQIVLSHGGRIWVESEAGKGSVFRFAIPLVRS